MLKKEVKDLEKINKLQEQNAETYQDYLFFLSTREEARKQLEAKFQDIYKKIEKLKEEMTVESKRVNDIIKAFQTKFENMLKELSEKIHLEMKIEREFVRAKFAENEKEFSRLEKMIIEEREERLRQTDEQLKPIRASIIKIEKEAEIEKQERIANEKVINRTIEDHVFELKEDISRETTERNEKLVVLDETYKKEFKLRDHTLANFQKKVESEIKVVKDEILQEMDVRFTHQNEIIDNISNFMKVFQDTLRTLGKDV